MNAQNDFITCYNCKKKIPMLGTMKIARTEECPYCTKDLHCCRMCLFFDPKIYNECRESNAERIVNKEKANYCDYFDLNPQVNPDKSKEELLSLADSLFKK